MKRLFQEIKNALVHCHRAATAPIVIRREIVQITSGGIALCSDGTVWQYNGSDEWRQLPGIPL